MNSGEKFDRIVRDIVKHDIIEPPTAFFTDKVMERLGIRKVQSGVVTKPILSNRAKIAIAAGYTAIIALIIIFSKGSPAPDSKYLKLLPEFQLPSLKSLFEINSQFLTLLAVLIGVGWLLIGLDKILKKFLLR